MLSPQWARGLCELLCSLKGGTPTSASRKSSARCSSRDPSSERGESRQAVRLRLRCCKGSTAMTWWTCCSQRARCIAVFRATLAYSTEMGELGGGGGERMVTSPNYFPFGDPDYKAAPYLG